MQKVKSGDMVTPISWYEVSLHDDTHQTRYVGKMSTGTLALILDVKFDEARRKKKAKWLADNRSKDTNTVEDHSYYKILTANNLTGWVWAYHLKPLLQKRTKKVVKRG